MKGNIDLTICNHKNNLCLAGFRLRYEMAWYTIGDYTKAPLQRPQWVYTPTLNPGISLLLHTQLGVIRTASHLLEWETLSGWWCSCCQWCQAAVLEDIPHLLLECTRCCLFHEKYFLAMLLQLAGLTLVIICSSADHKSQFYSWAGVSLTCACLFVCLPEYGLQLTPPPLTTSMTVILH